MSEMEMFIGTVKVSEHTYEPEDTDDFYDLEQEHGCHFVKVNGQLYEFTSIMEVDAYGFQTVIPQPQENLLLCYWYNGGAGLHEVAEEAIKKWLEASE